MRVIVTLSLLLLLGGCVVTAPIKVATTGAKIATKGAKLGVKATAKTVDLVTPDAPEPNEPAPKEQ